MQKICGSIRVDQFEYVHKVQTVEPFKLGESLVVGPFSGSKSKEIEWRFTMKPFSSTGGFGSPPQCQVDVTGRIVSGQDRNFRVKVSLSSTIIWGCTETKRIELGTNGLGRESWKACTYSHKHTNFSISLQFKVIRRIKKVSPSSDIRVSTEVLQKSLKGMLDSGDFADVVLMTPDGDIPAHKNMLAARSPVFRAMFSTNMLETKESRVNISDFKKSIVSAMLRYIYTGCVDEVTKSPLDMLLIADKYDLKELREACLPVVTASMSVEDAISKLLLADRFQWNAFKKVAMQFFRDNHLAIAKTPDYKEFVKTSLYLEAMTGK